MLFRSLMDMPVRARGVLDYIVTDSDTAAQMSTIVLSSFFLGMLPPFLRIYRVSDSYFPFSSGVLTVLASVATFFLLYESLLLTVYLCGS